RVRGRALPAGHRSDAGGGSGKAVGARDELLEDVFRFGLAGDTEGDVLLGAVRDGLRVALAVVAAGRAVGLRHGRVELEREVTRFRHLHALRQRDRLVVKRGRVLPHGRRGGDVVLLVGVFPAPERKALRAEKVPVPFVRKAHRGRAFDDEWFEVLRADGILALLGVAHHGLDVPGRELDLARLLVEAKVLAPAADHHDLRVEAAIDEEGAHRPARRRRRDGLTGPELAQEHRALLVRQFHVAADYTGR